MGLRRRQDVSRRLSRQLFSVSASVGTSIAVRKSKRPPTRYCTGHRQCWPTRPTTRISSAGADPRRHRRAAWRVACGGAPAMACVPGAMSRNSHANARIRGDWGVTADLKGTGSRPELPDDRAGTLATLAAGTQVGKYEILAVLG